MSSPPGEDVTLHALCGSINCPTNPSAGYLQDAASESPSPWGEGRGEGGRQTFCYAMVGRVTPCAPPWQSGTRPFQPAARRGLRALPTARSVWSARGFSTAFGRDTVVRGMRVRGMTLYWNASDFIPLTMIPRTELAVGNTSGRLDSALPRIRRHDHALARRATEDAKAPTPNKTSCHQNSRHDKSPITFVSRLSSGETGLSFSRLRAIWAVARKSRRRLMLHQRANAIEMESDNTATTPINSRS